MKKLDTISFVMGIAAICCFLVYTVMRFLGMTGETGNLFRILAFVFFAIGGVVFLIQRKRRKEFRPGHENQESFYKPKKNQEEESEDLVDFWDDVKNED